VTQIDLLERQAALIGVVLLVAGLNVLALRRHLLSLLLGGQIAVLGAALIAAARPDSTKVNFAAALILSTAALSPLGMAVLGKWRRRRGSVRVESLKSDGPEDA